MKKLKLFILVAMGFTLFAQTLPSATSSTNTEVITGSNADLDYVYTENGDQHDVSNEAEENDGSRFTAFGEENDDSQYLYLGSESQFSELQFIIEDGLEVADDDDDEDEDSDNDNDDEDEDDEDADVDLTWQYNDGDSWQELDIDEDETENFSKIGTLSMSFDVPSSWEVSEYDGNDAFWIRARMDDDLSEGAEIEQISATIFNVEVTVTDENGNYFTNLESSNFKLGNATDTQIYGVDDIGSGKYQLALQTEASDLDYTLIVEVDAYDDYAINIDDVDTDVQSFKIQLSLNTGCDAPFVDVDFHWGQTAITNLYCRGIIEGEGTSYMVNHAVTRVEFLKMAIMNADLDTSKYDSYDVPYRDVEEDEWYYEYVATAYKLEIIDSDGEYYPDGEISRVEALTILIRLAGVESSYTSTKFSDVESTDWFASIVRSATDYEVVEGYTDNTFKPGRNLTRAEAAVMVDNAYYAWYQN